MKKIFAGAVAAMAMMGCTDEGAAAAATETAGGGKAVVVYFSWSPDGNTRFAAETIAKKIGADIFEIKAAKPYASDFHECCDEAKPECYGKKLREIVPVEGLELAKYDVVLVGTPNWWGTMAPPVRTWVVQNKGALAGKRVRLFQTHGGGGMQRVGAEFAEAAGDGAKVLEAAAFAGATVRSATAAVEAFAKSSL